MTRAFLALQPPEPVLDAIEARLADLPLGRGRPTPRRQWHFTVQFLGDRADVDAVAGAFALRPLSVGPGVLRVGGARAMGRAKRAQVLAFGLEEGAAWMEALAGEVQVRLQPLGYERDRPDRPFAAHLTIARYREPTDLRAVRDALGSSPVGDAWTAGEVVLFSSELGSEGATHTEVARIPTG